MKMKLKITPQEIIDQYQLQDLEENGWFYMNILKGMPVLKQAARLANERLVHPLAYYGYAPVHHTPSLWKHESNRILFALVVDDFGIKSTSESATSHLLQSLRYNLVTILDTEIINSCTHLLSPIPNSCLSKNYGNT